MASAVIVGIVDAWNAAFNIFFADDHGDSIGISENG